MINELHQQIRVVALAREEAVKAKETKQVAFLAWQEEHAELLNSAEETATIAMEAEAKLRELTIQIFKETGNKSPALGVGIRELTKLEYDPEVALEWALEHKIALSLDRRLFETFAKTTPLPFVERHIDLQGIIAADLSMALPTQAQEVK